MEIEVGEYVRTEKGRIKKIIKIDKHLVTVGHGWQEWHYYCKFDKGETVYTETYEELRTKLNEDIKNHSFKPIDLIKVGDYVNGCRVRKVTENKVELEIVADVTGEYYAETISKNDIKSIVTKEQFESMEYKVGD